MSDTNRKQPKAEPAKEWPNTVRTREELDAALEAGLKSGVSPRGFEEITERAISRLKNGKL